MSTQNHQPLTSSTRLRLTIALAAISAFCAFAAIPTATAQTFDVIYSFGATVTDGVSPVGRLAIDAEGNLYGATAYGGTGNCSGGCGVVFKLDTTGAETVLYNLPGSKSKSPEAGVIRDPAGNLYGTTYNGGDSGNGTIYAVDPSGNGTVLHALVGGQDGSEPLTGLISMQGELYGTTLRGGDATCNCGVIFKISKGGAYHVIHRFTGTDGNGPQDLVADSAGNIYGAAAGGGAFGAGDIFKLDSSGTLTVLYSFPGGSSGSQPSGRITRDVNGNFHGTTVHGGNLTCLPPNGCGVVFRVDSAGNETILHNFGSDDKDGRNPYSSVVDDGGVLYGTTAQGGIPTDCGGIGCGTVFRIAKDGSYDVIERFTNEHNSTPGEGGTLVVDSAGNLYGISASGAFGGGEIFKITF